MNILTKLMKFLKKKDSQESNKDDTLKDSDVKEMVDKILSNIIELFSNDFGEDYLMDIMESEKSISLNTSEFILTFSYIGYNFFVTFRVGLSGQRVCELFKRIYSILDPCEIKIIEDSYYDLEEGKLKFGDDAIEVRQKNLLKMSGKQQCVICEHIYKTSLLNDNGLCNICDKLQDNIIWN